MDVMGLAAEFSVCATVSVRCTGDGERYTVKHPGNGQSSDLLLSPRPSPGRPTTFIGGGDPHSAAKSMREEEEAPTG